MSKLNTQINNVLREMIRKKEEERVDFWSKKNEKALQRYSKKGGKLNGRSRR